MKDTVGLLLREIWKEKGSRACCHPELSLERSFSGVITGAYLCTTCGALVENAPPVHAERTPSSKKGRNT